MPRIFFQDLWREAVAGEAKANAPGGTCLGVGYTQAFVKFKLSLSKKGFSRYIPCLTHDFHRSVRSKSREELFEISLIPFQRMCCSIRPRHAKRDLDRPYGVFGPAIVCCVEFIVCLPPRFCILIPNQSPVVPEPEIYHEFL